MRYPLIPTSVTLTCLGSCRGELCTLIAEIAKIPKNSTIITVSSALLIVMFVVADCFCLDVIT